MLLLVALSACTGDDRVDDTAPRGFLFGQTVGQISAVDARHVAVREGQAFVCAGQEGVYVFDVDPPTDPTYVDTKVLGGTCWQSQRWTEMLYIAAGSAGFLIVQIEPWIVLGEWVPGGDWEVRNVAIDTTYGWAYLQLWNGATSRIQKLDIDVPDLMGELESASLGNVEPGAIHERNGTVYSLRRDGRLDIFGQFLGSQGQRPGVTVGDGDQDLAITSDILFMVQGQAGLEAVRVTDPAFPTDVFTYDAQGREPHSVVAFDDRLYVAAEGALAVLDVTDPFTPETVSGDLVYVSNMQGPTDLVVTEDVAYIADPVDDTLSLVYVGDEPTD